MPGNTGSSRDVLGKEESFKELDFSGLPEDWNSKLLYLPPSSLGGNAHTNRAKVAACGRNPEYSRAHNLGTPPECPTAQHDFVACHSKFVAQHDFVAQQSFVA